MRIGLLVDSAAASKYVYELAEWAADQDDIAISHLLIQSRPSDELSYLTKARVMLKKHGLGYLLRQAAFAVLSKFESSILARSPALSSHFRRFNLAELVPHSVGISPIVSASGFVHRFSADDIKAIRALNLDVLLRCGSGILRGEILHAARLGVLSFHHGDNRVNRGGPPGFWEVFLRKNTTGFTIQQLTEELDGGNVLFRGCFSTKFSYILNQVSLYQKSNVYMKLLLKEMAKFGRLPDPEESFPYFDPLFKTPRISEQLRYASITSWNAARKAIDRFLLGRGFRWGVAFASSNWRSLVMWRATRIENPPGRFLADPFVAEDNGTTCCFVEDYDYQKGRGCISAYALEKNGYRSLGEAIVEPFHLSFPYVFRWESKLYMCPESAQNRDIRIYECIKFPMEWRLNRVVMADVSAADSMIFEHNGRWWLLTNIDPTGSGEDRAELFIFYADSPLAETWVAHAMNPIYVDSSRARNGGILTDGHSIFRVSQRPEFGVYGRASSIRKIVTLTENEYLESEQVTIEPNFAANICGTHHLHSNGSYSVFDFVERGRISRASAAGSRA